MEREVYNVDEEMWGDYTSSGPWELDGEIYEFIEDYPSHDCDGECHNVVVKRKSDGKYFQFEWFYDNGHYYFENQLVEVFPKAITRTVYE
jgi:hypothetical protein